MILPMKILSTALFLCAFIHSSAQTVHELVMNGEQFVPDTLYLAPGDSIHLLFDTTGHSMVQVPYESWAAGVPDPLIGFSMGEGTPNPGDIFEFAIDSLGTFYYLCMQHPNDEKGVIVVSDEFTAIHEHHLPGFKVYPQPASEVIVIKGEVPYVTIRIDDQQGRPIRTFAKAGSEARVDITEFPPGIYFVTLLDETEKPVAREKVMISR